MSTHATARDGVTLTVPMPESVTNASGASRHWHSVHTKKKVYWTALDILQLRGEIPPPPRVPLRRARIASVMYLGGAMDDDNALARHKPVLDWLKTRGYIADDRKKNLVWDALPEQIVKRDGNYRITVTLIPIDP